MAVPPSGETTNTLVSSDATLTNSMADSSEHRTGEPRANGPEKTTSALGTRRLYDTQDIEPGSMVGEYRVEGLLGKGAMGTVYAAIHPLIAKRAAIKILHPELSVNADAVERFVQEARAVNQIGHPNIVDIFAFGQMEDGRSFFAMEWLRGESLHTRLARSPLPVVDAIAILETISLALEAAHEAGIVHRDLKPDNIFLVETRAEQPQVKLLDFGIAKLLNTDLGRTDRTQTGNLLGTPAYISPEQARGSNVDHRTDISAFGAVAYELFTGSLPFPADNLVDMIAKQLFEPPPSAARLCADVTPALDELIRSMLAKQPDDRPSLATARQELRNCRRGLQNGAATHDLPAQRSQQTAPGPTIAPASTVIAVGASSTSRTLSRHRSSRRVVVVGLSACAAIGIALGVFFAVRPAAIPHAAASPSATVLKATVTPQPDSTAPTPAPAPRLDPTASMANRAPDPMQMEPAPNPRLPRCGQAR